MLDAFIIEQIRRRKEEQASIQPSLQLPLPEPIEPVEKKESEDPPKRQPIVIDIAWEEMDPMKTIFINRLLWRFARHSLQPTH